MAAATDQQVQQWANERTRPFAERFRALLLEAEDNNAAIGDVYEHLAGTPTWSDTREDGPPSLLAPGDVLAINTMSVRFAQIARGDLATDNDKVAAVNDLAAQLAVLLSACVQPVRT